MDVASAGRGVPPAATLVKPRIALSIERLGDHSLAALEPLVVESERDALRFLRRLLDEWASGRNRFDRPGEALFGARLDRGLVGVCGLNLDPYAASPAVGRVRHLYVLTTHRRRGVGRRLVEGIVLAAAGRFDTLRCGRTISRPHASTRRWDSAES
jgi:GNAT superfamily N-acetyltransferase